MATQERDYTHCHVFVDHSNLWIPGQKYAADEQKLKHVGHDPRFRVDLGKFLSLVVGGRIIDAALLYGSRPPPNDSVWSAAERMNFQVKVFDRAQGVAHGREKEVDMVMGVDISRHAIKCDEAIKPNTVFIIVTGDRDFLYPIQCALEEGIRIELWAWKTSMSTKFRQLANEKELLTALELDIIAGKFSFTAYKSTRVRGDIDPAHAIVFRELPNSEMFLEYFAGDLLCLQQLFFITPISSSKEKQDLVVEFPKARPDDILKQLEKHDSHWKACAYAEYTSQRMMARQQPPQTLVLQTSRYQLLSIPDTPDVEDTTGVITIQDPQEHPSTTQAKALDPNMTVPEDTIKPSAEPFVPSLATADPETYSSEDKVPNLPGPAENREESSLTKAVPQMPTCEDHETNDNTGWKDVVKNKPGARTHRHKEKETPCRWGIHCARGLQCKNGHTGKERELFAMFPTTDFRYWKIKPCTKPFPHLMEQCQYAHSIEDAWCLKCKSWGHFTKQCAG